MAFHAKTVNMTHNLEVPGSSPGWSTKKRAEALFFLSRQCFHLPGFLPRLIGCPASSDCNRSVEESRSAPQIFLPRLIGCPASSDRNRSVEESRSAPQISSPGWSTKKRAEALFFLSDIMQRSTSYVDSCTKANSFVLRNRTRKNDQ